MFLGMVKVRRIYDVFAAGGKKMQKPLWDGVKLSFAICLLKGNMLYQVRTMYHATSAY